MYTIMRDWGCTKYPMNRIERPPHSEVISAIRILDFQRKSRDVSELCELASYSMVPSTYVKLRYGIEDKCSTYEWLESYLMDRDDCCIEPDVRMNIPRIEAEMCAAAEKAVENIPGVRLPDFYLEGLDRELDKLGRHRMLQTTLSMCNRIFWSNTVLTRPQPRKNNPVRHRKPTKNWITD